MLLKCRACGNVYQANVAPRYRRAGETCNVGGCNGTLDFAPEVLMRCRWCGTVRGYQLDARACRVEGCAGPLVRV